MLKTTLIILMFFVSLCGYSQLDEEGFEGAWTTLTGNAGAGGPADWAIRNVSGPAVFWVQSDGSTQQPAFEGSHAAFLNRENVTAGTTAEDWLITKAFPLPENAQLRFFSKLSIGGNQASQYKIMVSTVIGDVATQTNTINFSQAISWTELTLNPEQENWTEKVVSLADLTPAIAPGTQIYIAFVMTGDNGDRWNIDNVKVASQCPEPTDLSAPLVNATSVNLNWNNPSGATSWEVEVLPANGLPTGTGINYTGILPYTATTTAAGTPIEANTDYKYFVRTVCEDNESNWAGPFFFKTSLCDNHCDYTFILQSSINFGGWSGGTMDVIQGGVTVVTLGPSFTVGTSQNVIVPLCDDIPFEVFWSNGGIDPSAVGFTVINSFGQTIHTMGFDSEEPQTTVFSHMANCTTPECVIPTGLNAVSAGTTNATIEWDSVIGSTWEYVVVEAGGAVPTGAGAASSVNTATIGSLTINTNYEFYVRKMCDNGGASEWAGPAQFSTSVCEPVNQCNYTFNMFSNQEDGWNGSTMTISQNGVNVAVIGDDFTTGASQSITVPLCNNIPFDVTWTEGGSKPWVVGLTILNNFGQSLFTLDFTDIPGNVLFSSTATCSTPLCIAPTGLGVTQTNMTSATLAWDELASTWEYYIAEAGAPAPTVTSVPTATTSLNPAIATNLTPATNYEYYLRLVCGNDTTSEWAGPFAFSTTACAPEDKCIFSFEMYCESNLFSSYEDNTMTIFQGGIAITTIGADFTSGISQTIDVPLCPGMPIDIFWNLGGFNALDKGLRVYNPSHEIVFSKPGGTGTQGTSLFTGVLECGPAVCPAPQELTITDIGLTSASLNWTETGSATSWEVFILPMGNGIPGSSDTGTVVTSIPYTPALLPNTPYQFYVRAICGEQDGKSNWSEAGRFATLITNDECSGAISVPVNPTTNCEQFVATTYTGATQSSATGSCLFAVPRVDSWYTFVATSTEHTIRFTNVVNTMVSFVVYEGDNCGSLTEVFCEGLLNQGDLKNLTPGKTYYIMALSLVNPDGPNSFNLCVSTPTPVQIDYTQYSVPELVTEVLVSSLCLEVSNITWRSGLEPGDATGIGMFTQGNSGFDIEKGIVLATHDVADIQGPNSSDLHNEAEEGWDGDDDLFNYITSLGIDFNLDNYFDASVLEFDFVPLTGHIQFPFIFASEEYGEFQCNFSDAFAFFLTHPDGTTTNLAVIPDTDIPVSVVTIRDAAYNTNQFPTLCGSENPEWFDSYYGSDITVQQGLNNLTAPINFNGFTKTLTAESDVIIGETYHIKLVIADRNDFGFNSAVYIGEFSVGSVDLGPDLLVQTETALCKGQHVVLDTQKDPAEYTFKWFLNGVLIEGQTTPTLTTDGEGTYTVTIHNGQSTCEISDSVIIEFYDSINNPKDLSECSSTGFSLFNLAENTPVILNGYNPANYLVTYHLTQADADAGQGALSANYTNTTQCEQTIFVRIVNTVKGCIAFKSFKLLAPSTEIVLGEAEDVVACGSYTLPALTVGNYYTASGATGNALTAGTQIESTQVIYIYASGGTNSNCEKELDFKVTILPLPEVVITQDCNENNQYELNAGFSDGSNSNENANFQWTNGQGETIGNNSSLIVSKTGIYNVVITPFGGINCPVSGTVEVTGISCDIPRGISPNNDGKNDEFDLSGLGVEKITIFNRYGEEVYHKTNYTDQWHGQHNNGKELPTATYYYMLQYKNGKNKTGWVYINRQE